MKLYSFFNSSTSYRVRIALALKNIAYQYQGVNIRIGEQSSETQRRLNPSKGVPVLETASGEILTQSMAIIQYLDDLYSQNPLIPQEPMAKARVLELANAIACDMHPINNLKSLNYLSQTFEVSQEQRNGWYQHWVREGFDAVEAHLERFGSGAYCFGEQPTLADCCLVPQVANALRMKCDLSAYPRILKVYQHCIKHPAFIEAAPKNQPDFLPN